MDDLKPFRLLSDEEFSALTTAGRIEYLKQAMEVRNRINRQVDAQIAKLRVPPINK